MNWGRYNENMIAWNKKARFKLLGPARKDRLFYIALGHLRVRIMQPFRGDL